MVVSSNLETERLLLRQWEESDVCSFARLNSDREVMRYFPDVLTKGESDNFISIMSSHIEEKGWGLWAVELKSNNEFVGFVGLSSPKAKLPFSPCVEVGWRLHKEHWGYGYATEAGCKSLHYAFNSLAVDEIVSFTTVSNTRSRQVMERLGMVDAGQNFRHPDLSIEHPLSEHVLYKVTRNQWMHATPR